MLLVVAFFGRTIDDHKFYLVKASLSWLRFRKYVEAFTNQDIDIDKMCLRLQPIVVKGGFVLDCNFDLVRFTFLEKTSILHMNTLL